MGWLGEFERLVEVGEVVALLGGAGLGGIGGEVRGHGVVEEQVALRFSSTNGATHTSPGHRPGFGHPTEISPVGAIHRAVADGLCRPLGSGVVCDGLPRALPWAGMGPGLWPSRSAGRKRDSYLSLLFDDGEEVGAVECRIAVDLALLAPDDAGRGPGFPAVGIVEDERVFFPSNSASVGLSLSRASRYSAGVFPEDVVDVFEGLFKHGC